jgi:hypothetical protein
VTLWRGGMCPKFGDQLSVRHGERFWAVEAPV